MTPRAEEPDLTPEQAEALHVGMLQARQLERSGDRAGAIRRAEELSKQFPGNRRVEDALAGLYRAEHRDDALLRLLRARAEREPDDGETARNLASLLLARGENAEALEALRHYVAANPKDENRYRLAGAMLASRDLTDAAIQIYRQGRQAIGLEALFAPELAQLELDRGDYAAAITEYLLLATIPERRPRVWREVTALLQRAEDRDAVLGRVEDMRRRYPKSAPIQDIAAMTYLYLGRFAEALAAIRAADSNAGDQGEHLFDFGRTALEGSAPDSVSVERARAGVEALQLLAERHPKSNLLPETTRLAAEGLVAVARVQVDQEERRRLLGQAVAIIDAGAPMLTIPRFVNQILALKGMILLEDLGQPAEALAVFERVARGQRALHEPDQMVRVQVALCQVALDRVDEARAALQEIVQSNSTAERRPGKERNISPEEIGWSRARYYLAELDLVQGRYQEARSGFAAVAERIPEDRLANDCLDLALMLDEAVGDDPAALQLFGRYRRAVLRRDPAGEREPLETLVREHAQSTLAPFAWYELAGVLASERQTDSALARYRELLAQYPQHRLAPRALEAIGDLELGALRQPDLAVASYERLLTDYPDDLFLDGVRKKLLAARAAAKGGARAMP